MKTIPLQPVSPGQIHVVPALTQASGEEVTELTMSVNTVHAGSGCGILYSNTVGVCVCESV